MDIKRKLILTKEEKELLNKTARLLWDIHNIDDGDLSEDILQYNHVSSFEDLGVIVSDVAEAAETQEE